MYLKWECLDECGKSRTDIEVVRVAPIEDKLIENKLRWFGHVQRKKSDMIMINEKNTNLFNLTENIALDKTKWQKMIHLHNA